MQLKTALTICLLSVCSIVLQAQESKISKADFENLNLFYPGLEKVNKSFTVGQYEAAAEELLKYYRQRKNIRHPEFNHGEEARFRGKDIGKANLEKANNALVHKFQPQKGYGFFDYGKDIDWQFWPVKDNEVRWQLHRVYWWQPMGLAYRSSADEKYAQEWVFQFRDWNKKNPLGLSAENDRYAWRPLEVSERVQSLPGTFNLFLNSPNFTPAFLMEFLKSYHQQADYIPSRYSEKGNHLLFEAQRILFAGAFFPEFKAAASWRKSGIEVLNTEIKKQVYPDGVQFELSPAYHVASIDIFLRAYNAAKMSGLEKEFPSSYSKTMEDMVMALISFTFPDYNNPMFGDSWWVDKETRIKQFGIWAKAFPSNETIKYFATDRKEGKQPDVLSKALTSAGFYTFRNGWNDKSTVLILKASQPGEFHAQPDNGTFELWKDGRNFTPDAGCYVYSGDAEIMKQREWFRQTRVHNTVTLNNENMVITKAKQEKWQTGSKLDVLRYTNPSYANLDHQRTVLFVDQQYFIVIDKVKGSATGNIAAHFQLKEDSKPFIDIKNNRINTTYTDGNNLLIQSLSKDVKLVEEEGKVSYAYQKEVSRPAFRFEKQKADDKSQYFITVLYPYGNDIPKINLKSINYERLKNDEISLILEINDKEKTIKSNP